MDKHVMGCALSSARADILVYFCQVRIMHVESTLGYMEKFFNNGSMTMTFHILKVQEELGGCAKDEMCTSSRNREIRRNIWK